MQKKQGATQIFQAKHKLETDFDLDRIPFSHNRHKSFKFSDSYHQKLLRNQ